jgi:hypothetical protein
MEQLISPIAIACSICGSTAVSRDAWARWDVGSQTWMLQHVFDYAYCHACDDETSLTEQPLRPFDHVAVT